MVTTSIPARTDTPLSMYVNADGLGDQAALRFELLNHKTIPIAKYSGENAAVVRKSGFQTPIIWSGEHLVGVSTERVRLKVTFEGERRSDIRLSAIYVR